MNTSSSCSGLILDSVAIRGLYTYIEVKINLLVCHK